MKRFFNLPHLEKSLCLAIRSPRCSSRTRRWAQFILAGGIAFASCSGFAQAGATAATTPVADNTSGTATPPQSKSKADPRAYTVVGYNRDIRKEDFAGFGKAAVLHMQKQLEAIYKNLPDWKHDHALGEQPLSDGIVGPITLSWLQRYGYHFKMTTEPGYARDFPTNLDRIAAFGAAYPAELDILLSKDFEDWDNALPDKVKNRDFTIRCHGNEQALLDLINRFRASRKTAPRATVTQVDTDDYFIYTLKQADLDLLSGKDQIIATLSPLKDKEFSSLDALKVALGQALQPREYLLRPLWPVVEKNTSDFYGFLINDTALDKLPKDGTVSASTLDDLRKLGTVYLKSRDAFDTFIADKTAAGKLTITPEETAILAEATRVFDNFHLDEQALDTIKNALKGDIQNTGVPAAVVHMLQQIKDVDYPDVGVFRSAAISKIAFGLGMCPLNSSSENTYVTSLRMSNDDLALFKKELEALHPQSIGGRAHANPGLNDMFARIAALRKTGLCKDADHKESKDIVQTIYQTYLGSVIENAARKKIPDEIAPVNIQGGKCGCALDELSGVVYGFYPYWNNRKTPQTINFRVLNRIAYYGLTVDNAGDFRLGKNSFDLIDGSNNANDFLRIAHQYNSKVDWMIQKNDWDGDLQNRRFVFKRMQANILALLDAPLTDPASKIKPYASFGMAEQPKRGDGVTLYFPNYPDDQDSTNQFNEFYLSLRAELDKRNLWLNILVAQDVFSAGKNSGPGAFGLSNLVLLRKKRSAIKMQKGSDAPENNEFILVLMNEPSFEAKKALRADIENDPVLHGANKADFLRSILPVLHFDNRNWQQLEDDIVYAHDNFGGFGFWSPNFDNLAQPVTDTSQSCAESTLIVVCLLKNYRDQTVSASLPGPLESFACVHRWALQMILTSLVLLAIVLAILFFRFCKVQNFIKTYFLWVLALIVIPAILVFTLLLLYDPFLVNLSRGNLPFLIASAIIVLCIIFVYRYLRARRQVPMRQHSMPQRQGLGFPIVVWTIENNKQGLQWIIKNRGTGYAIIKKVEILLDRQPVADVKTALESVMEAGNKVMWKTVPLVGQKLQPGESLAGLTITDGDAAKAFESRLKAHRLEVNILYCAASNEHWVSNGKEIMSIFDM